MDYNSSPLSSSLDWIFPLFTTVAVVGVTAIPLLQSDNVSRQILSPQRLETKRLATYKYRWEKFTTKAILKTLEGMGGDDNLELLVNDDEVSDFVSRCCLKTSKPKLLCLGIDEHIATRELCIWICLDQVVYQASLFKFGRLLGDAMEHIMTTTALCFIADASGGLGTRLVTNVLDECKSLHVPMVREPTWLAQFAVLVDEGLIPRATLEQCLFGLIRLEAHSYTEKTVCVTLPGQAVTAPLLPILQHVFPCERHVFVYDGCANVVSRCLLERKLPEEEFRRSFPSAIRHTTPLDRSLTKQIPPLADALRELPLQFADATECWMTSVNAMLQLKENEKTNQYLPFVCRLSLLLTQGTPEERHLALVNLLQFMTGSRSRPLPDGAVEEAEAVVSKYYSSDPPKLAIHLHRAVEDCVFRHKSILLGDKTLMDTVLPSKEWSLKAAKKVSGCSCCAPDDDEEEEEEEEDENGENKDGASSGPLVAQDPSDITTSVSKKSNYVDGKTKFAFDPSKFS